MLQNSVNALKSLPAYSWMLHGGATKVIVASLVLIGIFYFISLRYKLFWCFINIITQPVLFALGVCWGRDGYSAVYLRSFLHGDPGEILNESEYALGVVLGLIGIEGILVGGVLFYSARFLIACFRSDETMKSGPLGEG